MKCSFFPAFVFLILGFYQILFSADECKESKKIGAIDADKYHNATGWLLGGLAMGTITGVIGGPILIMISKDSGPLPLEIPMYVNRDCYVFGYIKKASAKNFRNSVIGTSIGTGLCILIVSIIVFGAQ
jgi:hypothetical protein